MTSQSFDAPVEARPSPSTLKRSRSQRHRTNDLYLFPGHQP